MKRFVARALIVVASILGIVFAQVPAASAQEPDLSGMLANLWTQVLETKTSQNPVAGNGSPCWDLGNRTVAPFFGGEEFSCKIKAGTQLFVVGFSFECSSIPGDDGDPPFTEANLRTCAMNLNDNTNPTVTFDGTEVDLTRVQTPALHPVLPKHNIFGAPADTYLSVADGWVALIGPEQLTTGTHTIKITGNFPANTTTIKVVGPPAA